MEGADGAMKFPYTGYNTDVFFAFVTLNIVVNNVQNATYRPSIRT